MDEPETLNAAQAALILAPVTPRPTDGVAPADPTAPQDAAAAPQDPGEVALQRLERAAGMVDRKGTPYDSSRHAAGPDGRGELTARGTWRLKGARGRPFALGNRTRARAQTEPSADDEHQVVEPPEVEAAQEVPQQTGPPQPRASFIAQPGPAPAPDVLQAEPVLMADPSEYKTTAEAITRGSFGVGQIVIGPEWEPTSPEAREWVAAWSAFLAEIQAPKLGSFASILVLAVTSWSRRAQHPATARASRTIMDTVRGWLGMRRSPQADPFAGPAPDRAQSVPAAQSPAGSSAAKASPAPSTATDAAAGPYSRGR